MSHASRREAVDGTRESAILAWLLDSDPSLRWQVLRDLVGASPAEVLAERQRVAHEGWGARLLREQTDDGLWADSLYSPKWTSTTYTLLLLQRLGLPAGNTQALAGCRQLWDNAANFGGGLNLAKSIHEPETCITGMLVLLAAAFGLEDDRVDPTVEWLVGQQLRDGGWNCESIRRGSTHGSFHTSIIALEALSAYADSRGNVQVAEAMARGRQFFLDHQLYRSHRTGDVVDQVFTRFPFPPQWHFDIVRGLEHFRDAGSDRPDQLADAIGVVRQLKRSDGTWPMYRPYAGRYWFALEGRGPSRWSTLRSATDIGLVGRSGDCVRQGDAGHPLCAGAGPR